jgi:hypothetical protein
MHWIRLADDREQWWAVVNTVMDTVLIEAEDLGFFNYMSCG